MLAYATLGSTDFETSAKFYDAVLACLGLARVEDYSDHGWIAFGDPSLKGDPHAQALWLNKTPFNGEPATVSNGAMLAFKASSKEQVDACHAAALANGGSSEGAPGQRDAYGPNFYIGYARDPMGNKFSVIYRA